MSDVRVQVENSVCKITLSRVHKKNALTHQMYLHMAQALEVAQEDDEIRCILIASEGDFFCAGNDLHDFVASKDSDKMAENVRFMHALINCSLPVVVKVQGNAVGIGVTMLLHCDLVFCAPDATFTMPFVDLALVPEFASSFLLPKLAGHRKAAKWLLCAEPLSAFEAEKSGLVTDVVARDELDARVDTYLSKVVRKPKIALMHTKALMKNEQDDILLHMNDELDMFIDQLGSQAAQEAFSAILEKRRPNPDKYK